MDKHPKVSVIIPVYKVEKFLDRCIESVSTQILKDIEIILVDDGSPDSCPDICDKWCKKDSRIKVVHKQNAGLGMACNSGIDIATGEYIAFCDSDDWVDPTMYEELYSAAINYQAQIVYSGIRQVNDKGDTFTMNHYNRLKIYKGCDIESFALDMIASAPNIRIERRIPMSAKIVLYRLNMIKANGIRFESERKLISEDLFFNLDCLAQASTIVEYPAVFYNYFINTVSLTNTVRTDRFAKAVEVWMELKKRYMFQNKAEFKQRINRFLIGYTRAAIQQICKSSTKIEKKLKLIKKICNDELWIELNKEYPVSQMPIQHRIIHYLIQQKHIFLLYLICKYK